MKDDGHKDNRRYHITEMLIAEMESGKSPDVGKQRRGRESRSIGGRIIIGKGDDEIDRNTKFDLSHLPAFMSKQKIVKETGVPRETIKSYIEQGKLEGVHFSGGKNTKYSTRQLSELLKRHNNH